MWLRRLHLHLCQSNITFYPALSYGSISTYHSRHIPVSFCSFAFHFVLGTFHTRTIRISPHTVPTLSVYLLKNTRTPSLSQRHHVSLLRSPKTKWQLLHRTDDTVNISQTVIHFLTRLGEAFWILTKFSWALNPPSRGKKNLIPPPAAAGQSCKLSTSVKIGI